jgi:DNA replication factor GINS
MAKLSSESEKSDALRAELLREEFERASEMIREIYLLRVSKAIDKVIQGGSPFPLLEHERDAFSKIKQNLEKIYTDLVSSTISGKPVVGIPREIANTLLIVQTEIPQIVDDNLRKFGPFKQGEVASLPKRCGELMIKHGLARKIEVES